MATRQPLFDSSNRDETSKNTGFNLKPLVQKENTQIDCHGSSPSFEQFQSQPMKISSLSSADGQITSEDHYRDDTTSGYGSDASSLQSPFLNFTSSFDYSRSERHKNTQISSAGSRSCSNPSSFRAVRSRLAIRNHSVGEACGSLHASQIGMTPANAFGSDSNLYKASSLSVESIDACSPSCKLDNDDDSLPGVFDWSNVNGSGDQRDSVIKTPVTPFQNFGVTTPSPSPQAFSSFRSGATSPANIGYVSPRTDYISVDKPNSCFIKTVSARDGMFNGKRKFSDSSCRAMKHNNVNADGTAPLPHRPRSQSMTYTSKSSAQNSSYVRRSSFNTSVSNFSRINSSRSINSVGEDQLWKESRQHRIPNRPSHRTLAFCENSVALGDHVQQLSPKQGSKHSSTNVVSPRIKGNFYKDSSTHVNCPSTEYHSEPCLLNDIELCEDETVVDATHKHDTKRSLQESSSDSTENKFMEKPSQTNIKSDRSQSAPPVDSDQNLFTEIFLEERKEQTVVKKPSPSFQPTAMFYSYNEQFMSRERAPTSRAVQIGVENRLSRVTAYDVDSGAIRTDSHVYTSSCIIPTPAEAYNLPDNDNIIAAATETHARSAMSPFEHPTSPEQYVISYNSSFNNQDSSPSDFDNSMDECYGSFLGKQSHQSAINQQQHPQPYSLVRDFSNSANDTVDQDCIPNGLITDSIIGDEFDRLNSTNLAQRFSQPSTNQDANHQQDKPIHRAMSKVFFGSHVGGRHQEARKSSSVLQSSHCSSTFEDTYLTNHHHLNACEKVQCASSLATFTSNDDLESKSRSIDSFCSQTRTSTCISCLSSTISRRTADDILKVNKKDILSKQPGENTMFKNDLNFRGDLIAKCDLPTLDKRHGFNENIRQISVDTLFALMNQKLELKHIQDYLIIDCRFPYEHNGGHIKDALNFWYRDQIIRFFFTDPELSVDDPSRLAIIFHCEFSSHRAPSQYAFMRTMDLLLTENFPQLIFPEMYVLEGGYKDFFSSYPHLCKPSKYKEMKDPSSKLDCVQCETRLRNSEHKIIKTWEEETKCLRDFITQYGVTEGWRQFKSHLQSQPPPSEPATPRSQQLLPSHQ